MFHQRNSMKESVMTRAAESESGVDRILAGAGMSQGLESEVGVEFLRGWSRVSESELLRGRSWELESKFLRGWSHS